MLAKRIIPCLDVKDGRVVKGIQFLQLRDAGDPVELGHYYTLERADELVFLDITASKENRRTIFDLAERVARKVFIPFTIGGGISTVEDIREIVIRGADKVSINTAAIYRPELISEGAEVFGSQCIVVAIDARRRDSDAWEVYSHGGSRPTGIDAIEWARKVEQLGAGEILLTSMDMDGRKTGYDIELTRRISETINIPVIASGGGGSPEHIRDVFIDGKADAALAASIFHYKEITIRELKYYLQTQNIPVRL
ncbi:imidazole glycerol phosphate synthase subunit HisF [candidate division KSB1 bacterium]|nr:imidazole glycerol phosphate synthase subunit HisF [candidate division KSB1 bacterium]